MTEQNPIPKSRAVLSGLDKKLKSRAEYHPQLKVIAYERKNDGENFFPKRMFRYLCEQAGSDSDELRRLNKQREYLIHFPHLRGFFMELFGGYQRI
jgi:hypothetical protein